MHERAHLVGGEHHCVVVDGAALVYDDALTVDQGIDERGGSNRGWGKVEVLHLCRVCTHSPDRSCLPHTRVPNEEDIEIGIHSTGGLEPNLLLQYRSDCG